MGLLEKWLGIHFSNGDVENLYGDKENLNLETTHLGMLNVRLVKVFFKLFFAIVLP